MCIYLLVFLTSDCGPILLSRVHAGRCALSVLGRLNLPVADAGMFFLPLGLLSLVFFSSKIETKSMFQV